MNWKSLPRFAGVLVSAVISIFSGHGLQAKTFEGKSGSKETKKARPSGIQESGDELDSIYQTGGLMDPPRRAAHSYPWRESIVTTTFWVGERPSTNNPVPNHKSSWDGKWAENYGGTDTPDRKQRTGEFIPAAFVPQQNPFYVALPYNDKASTGHKAEASTVIPWFKDAYRNPGKSVCKGRWLAIRRGDRVCYAQWEDAGPFRTDHWQYVFGNERPKPNLNRGAGLDVSPAVRDFLGMADTDVTDWKFVEFDEIPPGPWSKYGDNNTFVINSKNASAIRLAALEKARK